jgi:hypothetical protein
VLVAGRLELGPEIDVGALEHPDRELELVHGPEALEVVSHRWILPEARARARRCSST